MVGSLHRAYGARVGKKGPCSKYWRFTLPLPVAASNQIVLALPPPVEVTSGGVKGLVHSSSLFTFCFPPFIETNIKD